MNDKQTNLETHIHYLRQLKESAGVLQPEIRKAISEGITALKLQKELSLFFDKPANPVIQEIVNTPPSVQNPLFDNKYYHAQGLSRNMANEIRASIHANNILKRKSISFRIGKIYCKQAGFVVRSHVRIEYLPDTDEFLITTSGPITGRMLSETSKRNLSASTGLRATIPRDVLTDYYKMDKDYFEKGYTYSATKIEVIDQCIVCKF